MNPTDFRIGPRPVLAAAMLCVAAWSAAWAAAPSQSADQDPGKALVEASCLSCHDTSVFTRPDRFIHSASALKTQVAHCAAQAAKVSWSQAQIQEVADYLGRTYYGFGAAPGSGSDRK